MKLLLAILVIAGGTAASLPKLPSVPSTAGPMPISIEADNMIVRYETGGRGYYDKYCSRPSDPGFSSGVTVGFGYDLKYKTRSEIARDWSGVCTAAEVRAMQSVCGLDGSAYRRIRNDVHITWDEALRVYRARTLPKWQLNTKHAYKLPENFHPHRAGALVGNTFNRGTRMAASRDLEKRQIRAAIAAGEHEKVPGLFYAQQKYWKGHKGLTTRRREEGDLGQADVLPKIACTRSPRFFSDILPDSQQLCHEFEDQEGDGSNA